MSETNTPPQDDAGELVTLRKVNAELLQTKHTLKARVTTLEGEALQLTEKADKAIATMRAVVIDQPLKKLADEVSSAPALFMRELLTDYKVEARDDGTLMLQSKDGKQVAFEDGKPVTLNESDIRRFLLSSNDQVTPERRKEFSSILTVRVGSGGAGRAAQGFSQPRQASSDPDNKKGLASNFGLR
jgi:hypothetical protein